MILGPRSQTKRSEAREALEREITKQNGQTGDASKVMNDGSVSFGWFVRNRFLPLKEANWKEETSKVKKLLIQKDLIDPFDKVPLENFDKFTLQAHLNNLAQTRSRDRILQMRATLRDRVLLELDMTNALRPSELFALRWKCFNLAESTNERERNRLHGQDSPVGQNPKESRGYSYCQESAGRPLAMETAVS